LIVDHTDGDSFLFEQPLEIVKLRAGTEERAEHPLVSTLLVAAIGSKGIFEGKRLGRIHPGVIDQA
jgi:hypothetical protein